MVKVETYIAIPTKHLNPEERAGVWFELFYSTLIPVIAAVFLGITRHPIFLIPILLPFIIKLKLIPGKKRIYKNTIKEHLKNGMATHDNQKHRR